MNIELIIRIITHYCLVNSILIVFSSFLNKSTYSHEIISFFY